MNHHRILPLATSSLLVIWVALLAAGVTPRPNILLDDFESGTHKWVTNDAFKQTGGAEAMLCDIVPAPGAPEDGRGRAALLTFRRARDSWASVSLAVDGNKWNDAGARQLSFWFKGDGSNNAITLMLRTRGGTVNADRFSVQLPLSDTQWKRLLIPLDRLRSETRTALDALPAVYLLQFVKVGSWESLFFNVDHLVVQGDPSAEPGKRPPESPPTPTEAPPLPKPPGDAVTVTVDFSSLVGKTKLRLGGNLLAHPERIVDNPAFRQSVTDLGVRLMRVNIAQLVVPKLEGEKKGTYDFSVLDRVVNSIHTAGAQPILCLVDDPAWLLTEDAFIGFCAATVRRYSVELKKRIAYYEILNEPTSGPKAIAIQPAMILYNKARKAMRAMDPNVKIGGVAEGSAWLPHLQQALARADGLDFLSFHFYGARNASATDTELLDAGVKGLASDLPHQIAPRGLYELVARSATRKGTPIFVTECAPNANRGDAGEAHDLRLSRLFAAAWWVSFLGNAARWADLVCVTDLSDESWGFLDPRGRAFPAFYATWLYQTYAAPGSIVVKTESASPTVLAYGVNTRSAHNLFLVNLTPQPVSVAVAAKGLNEPLTLTRVRAVEDTSGLKARNLTTTTTPEVTLAGYGVHMVQFVEQNPTNTAIAEPSVPAKRPATKGKTRAKST